MRMSYRLDAGKNKVNFKILFSLTRFFASSNPPVDVENCKCDCWDTYYKGQSLWLKIEAAAHHKITLFYHPIYTRDMYMLWSYTEDSSSLNGTTIESTLFREDTLVSASTCSMNVLNIPSH